MSFVQKVTDFRCNVFNARLLVFTGYLAIACGLPVVVGCGHGTYITSDQAETECHELQVSVHTEEL